MSTATLRPYQRGGGAVDDLTWTYLDESTYNDSDYVEKVAGGSTSYGSYYFYYMRPVSAFYGTISSIKICGRAWVGGAYTWGRIKFAVYIGGVAYGYSGKSVASSGALFTEELATNPATGLAWTMADVINLQAGFALASYNPDYSGYTRCSQFYVEVNYTLPGNATEQSLTLRPNAAGDITQLTAVGDSATYLCVDEETADGDTTYVKSGTEDTWKNDLYGLPECTIGNIQYVALMVNVRGGGYSNDKARPTIKTHSTSYYVREIDFDVFGTAYMQFWTIWRLNPNTGLAWTPEEINDLQAGVGIYTAFPPPNYPVRCTQIYVYVAGVYFLAASRPKIVGLTAL